MFYGHEVHRLSIHTINSVFSVESSILSIHSKKSLFYVGDFQFHYEKLSQRGVICTCNVLV